MATEPTVTVELIKTRMTLLDKWYMVAVAGFIIYGLSKKYRRN